MKTFPKIALAAALFTGASGLALVAPAVAKDKKEAEKPGMKFTPAALKAAQVAQPAIAAKDFATAEPAVVQLEAAATSDDDKYIAAALRYDLEQQKLVAAQAANPKAPIDETVLARPLDALLASASTPPADKGRYAFRRGLLSFNSKQFPQALQYFTQAKQLGATNDDLGILTAQSKMETGDMAGSLADFDAVLAQMTAAGQKPPESYYKYVIARTNARKMTSETVAWMEKWVMAYPTTRNWRDMIVTYGLQQNPVATLDEPQKIDLFRLMRATRSLADQNDYIEYADDVNRRGLPAEAQAVLKEGIASGKIPAANRSAKDLLTAATAASRADAPPSASEKKAAAAADGKIAASTGDVYLGMDNFTKAAELYRLAIQKGGVNADEVNTRLGIALARSGDKAGAKTAFGAVKTAPRAGIASLWTTYVDAPPAA